MFFPFLRVLAAAATAVVLALVPLSAAHADTAADDTITWMVRPSDGTKEDGRSWVEMETDAGATVQEHMLVRNLSKRAVTFALVSADGYFTDRGRFNMRTTGEKRVDAGSWIDMQAQVEVPSGGDVVVPFRVTVPQNATPGDHLAGVAATVRSGGGDQIGVESRVGFRVMVRVAGEITPSASAAIEGHHDLTIDPFEPGATEVSYTLTNTGNANLALTPEVRLTGLFGLIQTVVPQEPIATLAPGESRTGHARFENSWPLFLYGAEVVARAEVVGGDDPPPADEVRAHSFVLALPLSQALVALIMVMLVLWFLLDRRQRERRLAELQRKVDTVHPDAPLRRRDRRGRARAWSAGVRSLGLAALLVIGVAPAASAAEPDDEGVVIVVEIPGVAPTPSPTEGGPASPAGLARTGVDPGWTAAVLGGVLVVGGGVVVFARRPRSERRRRSV